MKYWLINYLSPGYLLLRIFFLAGAFIGYFITMVILAGKGWETNSAHNAGIVVGLLLAYNALRPWKIGMSINDINNKLDDLNKKYK